MRIAVVGAGHLGRIHAKLLRARDDVRLVGVVDPDPEARRQAPLDRQTRVCGTLEELGDDFDAAIVAVPTRFHHPVGMELTRRGKHVFMEKPLAGNLWEADDLVSSANRHGVVLQVGHIERFNPAWTASAERLVHARYIEGSRLSGYTFRSTDIGVVFDLMIHDLDLVLSTVRSPVTHVDACGTSVLGNHVDVANARIVFEDGCVANLTASRVSYKSLRRMHVWTPSSFARLDFTINTVMLVNPREDLLRREFDERRLTPAQKNYLREKLFVDLLPIEHVATEQRNAMVDEHDDFLSSVNTGKEPRVPGWQGREAVALAERIERAIAGHNWNVHVPESAPRTLPLPVSAEGLPPRREAG